MKSKILCFLLLSVSLSAFSQISLPFQGHPDTSGWEDLFKSDLSDADYVPGIWKSENGVFTADEDQIVFTKKEFANFMMDLEFLVEPGANSGVVVYCTNKKDWIPHSVEIQILDDFHEKWANVPGTWQCASVFGHLAPKEQAGKKAGEWNRMTIACKGQRIFVILNGKSVIDMDMAKWTSSKKNPDGSEIPEWLSTPFSELPVKGFIGLQGKHAGAKTFYKNLKIKSL